MKGTFCFLAVLCLTALTQARVTHVGNHSRFEMHINEEGAHYTEVIEVYPEKGIEKIQVPAHNDVDGSTYIHHFPSNLTLRVMDAYKACYISDMRESSSAEELSEPNEMIDAMNREEDGLEEVLTEVNAWGIGGRVEDMTSLPEEFQTACKNYEVSWLVRIREGIELSAADSANDDGNIEVTPTFSTQMAASSRRRRDLFSPSCTPGNLRARCKVERRSCAHYKRRYDMFRTCELRDVSNSRRTSNYCPKIAHIIDTILCCRECCGVQSQADSFFPYCETMPFFHCGTPNEDGQKKW